MPPPGQTSGSASDEGPATGSDLPTASAQASPAPAKDPRVGSTLGQGKYLITGKLGEGGMGIVYEAEDTRLQRRVALKLLPEAVADNPAALERFLREARAAARLNHPNVVSVLDVEQRENETYIVMELVRGGSAADLSAKRGPLPWQNATRIIIDACRGLVAAHAVGLIHRDIKPANILLHKTDAAKGKVDGSETVRPGPAPVIIKLADFGLAKILDHSGTSLTNTGSVMGTPDYMSPEQCRSDQLDDRSDIYSLGATFFKLLTGRAPYVAETPLQVLFAHCEKPVPDPRELAPEVPEACAAVVCRAMAKEPSARFQSAAEFLTALSGLASKTAPAAAPAPVSPKRPSKLDPTTAPAPPAPKATRTVQPTVATEVSARPRPKTRVPSSPKRWLVVGGLAALLLVAGLAIFFLVRGPRGSSLVAQTGGGTQPDAPPTVPGRASALGLPEAMGGRVESVAFSPDGKWFAAAAADGSGGVRVWDFPNRKVVADLWKDQPIRSIAFSADSRALLAGIPDAVGRWDVGGGAPVSQTFFGGGPVPAVAYSPLDNGTIAFAVNSRNGKPATVRFRGKIGWVFELPGPIECLAITADGNTLAAGGSPSFVRLWDLKTGKPLDSEVKVRGAVHGLAFSPPSDLELKEKGRFLGVASDEGLVFKALDPGGRDYPIFPGQRIHCVTYSPDGRYWACGRDDGVVFVRDNVEGGWQNLPQQHGPSVLSIAFSPDGRTLATGSSEKTVRLWDLSRLGK